MAEFRIIAPGLSVEATAQGEAAGQAVLDAAGVSAHEAAAARFKLEMADDGSVESDLPRDQINFDLSEREWTAAMAWGQAQDEAVTACCGGWENRPTGWDIGLIQKLEA